MAILAVRLLDVDGSGDEQRLARGVYRPDASGRQVFQLHPMGYPIADGHHLQLEFMGHEAPTMRQSNASFAIELSNLDLRIPVAQLPDGQQIREPAPERLPEGYLLARFLPVPALPALALPALLCGLLASGWLCLRGRRGRAR